MEQRINFGPFAFDAHHRTLTKNSKPVLMGQKSLGLLAILLYNANRPVSKSALTLAVWQTENVEESNLPVQIAALRKILGKHKNGEEWIITVPRFGYQFVNHSQAEMLARNLVEKPTIAVLPFNSLTKDERLDYFNDAITADVITELARWHFLAVLSHRATLPYRDTAKVLSEIAAALKARFIVEGSLRRFNSTVRISVELVDAVSGIDLWAEKFDYEEKDLTAVQDQLVRTVVSTVVGQLQTATAQRANRKPSTSLLAYECLLKGNSLRWDIPTEAEQAKQLFTQAIELDPNYGLAYAALSTLRYRYWLDDLGSSNATLEEAHVLAQRGFELDAGESSILAALAEVTLFRKQFDLAEHYIDRALEVNPNNQWSVADRGNILFRVGHPEEALKSFVQARKIDSYFNPPWYWSCLGQAQMVLQRYEDALASFENFPSKEYWVIALRAACHAQLRERRLAQILAAECVALKPNFSTALRMAKEAFKIHDDARRLTQSLRLAGLPE